MTPVDWTIRVVDELFEEIGQQFRQLQSLDGVVDELREFTLLFPSSMCVLWITFAIVYVLRRESRLPRHGDCSLSVAVVVPAHNEELVMVDTIEGLLRQSYGNMQIHVVSDGSTDRTVQLALRYQSRGVRVHELNPNRGKSAALQHALDHIETDLFMVVDADTIADRNAVFYMVQQFENPRIAGVTGNPHVRNIRNSLLAMQAMEYTGIIGLIKRADSFWGGLFTVSGAAACFRTGVLRAVGGWSSKSVTEDIEISWRIQKAGHELAYEPRALFAIQGPSTYRALIRQRCRWAQGLFEVMRRHGNLATTINTALIPISVQVVGTALWMILLLAHLPFLIVAMGTGRTSELTVPGSNPLLILAVTMSVFLAQTLVASTFDGHYRRGVFRVAPLALLYPVYYWAVIAPSFLIGAVRGLLLRADTGNWQRTDRTSETTSW